VKSKMATTESRPIDEGDVTLADCARTVWRYRRLIVGLCLCAVLVTFVLSITSRKIYESTATLLAPKEGTGTGLLAGLAGSGLLQQGPGFSVPSLTPNRDMQVSILKSRTVAQAVVERFRLQERYGSRYLEDAIHTLQRSTTISVSREGVIAVKTADTDPRVAAEMANFYTEELDRLFAEFGTGEGGRQRVFLTQQLARAKATLAMTESELRRFQERHKAIALQEQTRGAIEVAARLKADIMAADVQFQVMRNFATETNPEMVAIRRRIEEMRSQLARLQYGDPALMTPTPNHDQRDFTVPFPKVPEIGMELARLTRDVKVQETLVTLLTQQLEQARMVEARDLPIVQVLDRAVPAERHSRPRLPLNLAVAGATSLIVGSLFAFLLEYVGNVRRRARAA